MTDNIKEVRAHYVTLRELVIRNAGGWDDPQTRAAVLGLCDKAEAALDDAECRERLNAVRKQAADLYSHEGHQSWARKTMSGPDYLRLQILIALEALNTRLFLIDAVRAR